MRLRIVSTRINIFMGVCNSLYFKNTKSRDPLNKSEKNMRITQNNEMNLRAKQLDGDCMPKTGSW
jgi:hypothetical protein